MAYNDKTRLVIKHIDIPACNKAEGIITCAILASIELLYGKTSSAHMLVSKALEFAEQLTKFGGTYHAPHISKFACFKCNFGDSEQVMPLPIINDVLILPEITLQEVVDKIRQSIPKTVNLKDVSISYFRVKLDIKKTIDALNKVKTASDNENTSAAIGAILYDSLVHENKPSDPIEAAGDYFILARNLISKGNVTLTRIVLRNANDILEELDFIVELTFEQRKHLNVLQSNLKAISEVVNEYAE